MVETREEQEASEQAGGNGRHQVRHRRQDIAQLLRRLSQSCTNKHFL